MPDAFGFAHKYHYIRLLHRSLTWHLQETGISRAKDLEDFHKLLQKLEGEIRIVMEATGIYHLPVLTFLHDKGYFVSVVNPFAMKKYAKDNSIRRAKTDKLDSIMIANYGIEKWFKLQSYEGDESA